MDEHHNLIKLIKDFEASRDKLTSNLSIQLTTEALFCNLKINTK